MTNDVKIRFIEVKDRGESLKAFTSCDMYEENPKAPHYGCKERINLTDIGVWAEIPNQIESFVNTAGCDSEYEVNGLYNQD